MFSKKFWGLMPESALGRWKLYYWCSEKLRNISRKTLVLESPFNKIVGLTFCNFIKKRFRCFPVNTYFEEHLQTTASAVPHKNLLLKVKSSLAVTVNICFFQIVGMNKKEGITQLRVNLVWTKVAFAFAPEIFYHKYSYKVG